MMDKTESSNHSFQRCVNESIDAMIKDNIRYNADKSSTDYFETLMFSIDGFSTFTVVLCFVGLLISLPGLTAIVWYEKYGNHRNR